jgi:uncharacterized Zn finger protein
MSYWDYSYPKPSKPRQAKEGIKARSQRGAFGCNWWSKRWFEVLESYHLGGRLTRGKSYARQGQVLSLEVNSGLVTSSVQGSQFKPYQVQIKLQPVTATGLKQIAAQLVSQPLYLTRLLTGEMPEGVEQLFDQAGAPLYPQHFGDLHTSCSCPDSSNPCKHIAAVFFILGEEFDRDPWLLFRLRGIERQELLDRLDQATPGIAVANKLPTQSGVTDNRSRTIPEHDPAIADIQAALPIDPVNFWQGQGSVDLALPDTPKASLVPAALPRQLGDFPFWQGSEPLLTFLEAIYPQIAQTALELMLREKGEH